MKKYIIINGKDLTIIEKASLSEAVTYAQNYMNHSEEVIVREVNSKYAVSTA